MATQIDEDVAAADKEMEERAKRAKELLSQRYTGLKKQQVGCAGVPRTLARGMSKNPILIIMICYGVSNYRSKSIAERCSWKER